MPKSSEFRLPSSSDRTVICGQSGSGKTQAGIWLLSKMDIQTRPWVVFDYKGEELIHEIPGKVDIEFDAPVNKLKPGVNVLRAMPGDEEAVTDFLWRVFSAEGIGLYFDEGYMVGQNNKAFNACLTQGRSKHIPMITLTQRPVKVSPWVFSEAMFWMVFDLIKRQDREKVADDVPIPVTYSLPRYHSYYYDVAEKRLTKLAPVPSAEKILAVFDKVIPKRRNML